MHNRESQQLAGSLLLAHLTKNPPFLTRSIDQQLVCEHDKRPKPRTLRLPRENFDLRPAVYFTEMNERLSPRLKVSVNGVTPSARRGQCEPSPQSLRRRGNVVDVRCRIRLCFFSIRDPDICLHEDHRIARLCGERHPDGKVRLSITLTVGEAPFEFQMDRLKDIVENDITWRESMAENYSLRFHITFSRPTDASSVWQALDLPISTPPQKGLFANWTRLPRCPTSNELLPLFVAKDTTTKYVLDVKMGWGTEEWLPRTSLKRPATPLECLNALKRQKTNTQLLTPASTPRSGTSDMSTDTVLRYHINGHMLTLHGYQCFLKCRPYDFGSLDKLEFHIANCHPMLGFVVDPDSNSAADESHTDIVITKGVTDTTYPRSKSRSRSLATERCDSVVEDFDWQAPEFPNTPISLPKVLRDKRWTVSGRQMRAKEAMSQAAPIAPTFASAAQIRLELPQRIRQKKAVVPHPRPNVKFMSSDNKAALTTGEVLSDEDDGVDESHLEVARSTQMASLVPDPRSRKFLLDINSHIESEALAGDKYIGPCLRRWLHKRQSWIQDPNIAGMFKQFISAALAKGYVSDEVYKACMAEHLFLVANGETRPSPDIPDSAKKRRKDECSCGKGFTGVWNRMVCANKNCEYPDYHKSCILNQLKSLGKDEIPEHWYCPTCIEGLRTAINQHGPE